MNFSGRIESPTQILRHQSNDSKAKYHWSFGKSARFKQPRGYSNTISYEIPTTKSNRTSGFGFGNRSTIFDGNHKDYPAPGKYQNKSDFKGHKDRGFSFGSNRDDAKYANYLRIHQNTPAAYDLNQKQVKKTKAYSLRIKTAYPKNYFIPNDTQNQRISKYPGPGRYQTIDLLGSSGNFYSSKHRNQNQKSFIGSNRFSQQKATPGPTDYKINTIEPDGIYVLSNMRSSGRRAILNEKRQLKLVGNKETPGPGLYQKPSDFGHYDKPQSSKRPQTARV